MRVVLLSERAEDKVFFESVANKAGLAFQHFSTAIPLVDDLARDSGALVVCDASTSPLYSNFENSVANKLGLYSAIVNPNTYFFLGSQPFSTMTHLHNSQIFGNYIERPFKDRDQDLVSSVFQRFATDSGFGLEKYFSPLAKQQLTVLKKSTDKRMVLEALTEYLMRSGMNSRAAAIIVNGADELLLNAFFAAPIDDLGKPLYENTARSTPLEPDADKTIEFKIVHDEQMLGLSVSDNYGSLDRAKIVAAITKNFSVTDFKPKVNVAGARLGLMDCYVHAGGMIFCWEPGNRSEIMLFYRRTNAFRPFREQFRFLSTFTNAV